MAKKKQAVNQNFTMEDVLRAGYRIRAEPEITEVVAPEPEPTRGLLRGAADLGLEAASGAAKGIKFMSDVFGADNPVSQGLQGVSDFAKELQSAQAKGEDQRIAQLMKEAEDKGIGEQVKAALRAAGEAPVRQAIGAIGTSVPMIAASMVPGLREASWGTRAAALGGMGGAQGVGVVKSSMYDSVYQRAIEEGRSEQEARALAQQAQAYSPENAGDIALGGVLGVGAALTGFEPAAARAVGGAAAKTAATRTAQRGLMQSTLRGTMAEMIPEGTQGFQEQVAGNRAEQRAGFDTPTFRGAAGSATLEGLLSAPGGAVGGMLDARGAKPAPKLLADQIRATESVPETGPMTRAANQAVEAKAQQVEMTAGAEGAALAAMEKQAQDDLKGLRDFAGRSPDVVAGMPVAGARPAVPGAEPSAEFIDSPFLDRIQTVQEMLADPATREKVRARWGDEGLNNIAYYAGMANRTGLPEKTQENLLGMAERLLSESVLTPIQPAPELGGMRRDPLTLGNQPQPAAPALGMDGTPSGRFTVDPQGNVAPESRVQAMEAQRRAEEAASLGKQTPRGQAQPETTMQGALGIGMDTAPTGRLLAGQDGVRPETRMDAINIGQADMQRQAEAAQRAEVGLTPDIEAVQQRNAMRPQDGDILNPSGKPFKTLMAAQRAAKKSPGEIVEVTGGFAIRPATMVAAQPEVANDGRGNQAAAGLAEALAGSNPEAGDRATAGASAVAPGEMLDALPGQPAGAQPAQGNAGQGQRVGREGYDTPVELDAASLKAIIEKTRGEPLATKPAKLEAWRNGTAKTDPAKYPIELAFTTDGRLDVNDGRHRIALAAERGEKVTAFIDGKDARRAQELLANVQNLPQPTPAQAPADQAPEAARGDGAAPAGVPEQGGAAAAVEAAGVDQQQLDANAAPANESKKPGREEIEAEVVRQVSDAWSKQTSGGFVVNKHYPAVVQVNGRERKLGLFKRKGDGTLYAEALEQTVYGPSFTQFKVTKDGKLEKVGDRNLYGRDRAVADQAIAEFNSLFDGLEKATSGQETSTIQSRADLAARAPLPKGDPEQAAREQAEMDGINALAGVAPAREVKQAQDETPFTHAGLKIKTQRIKVGDGVETRWVVQSPENAEREARGERQIGGDRIVDSREQAIQAAEEEVARDADDKARKAAIDAERKVQADAEEARKAANRGKTVAERRSSAILDKQTKLPTSLGLGNGSRRQAMENAVEQGRAIVSTKVRDDTAKRRDEAIVATAKRAGYMLGLSNENIPVVKAALEADKRLKANDYTKPEYRVYSGSNTNRDSFAEISKTEYDYAQELLAKRSAKAEPEQRTEYPFGQVANGAEDRFFRSRVRVLPDMKGETAWEGEVGSVLNGGRLVEVKRDGQDFRVRIPGDRIEVLQRVDAEQAVEVPTGGSSLNSQWDAILAKVSADGKDQDKGQRSYRALASLVKRLGEPMMEVWGRWGNFIGSQSLVEKSGDEVLRWMEGNLTTALDGYASGLPSAPVSNMASLQSMQRAAEAIEGREKGHNEYIEKLELQAKDVEQLGGSQARIAEAYKAIIKAKQEFNRRKQDILDGLKQAEQRAKEQQTQEEAEEAAKYQPADAKDLQKKPTPASIEGWSNAVYKGDPAWTNGHLVDFVSEPHLKGWQDRMNALRKDAAPVDVERVIPKPEGSKLTVIGVYDGDFSGNKAGLVYLESNGRLAALNRNYYRYFASKFKDVEFRFHGDTQPMSIYQGDRMVGLVMGIKLGRDVDLNDVKARIAANADGKEAAEGTTASEVDAQAQQPAIALEVAPAETARAFPYTSQQIASAYAQAESAIRGKTYSPNANSTHKGRIKNRLVDLGISEKDAQAVVDRATSIHASQPGATSGGITFLRARDLIEAAIDRGLVAKPTPEAAPKPAASEQPAAQGFDRAAAYEQVLKDVEDRANKFGRENIQQETSSRLASMALGREFGESMESYLARNPLLEAKHAAYKDWLASGGAQNSANTNNQSTDQSFNYEKIASTAERLLSGLKNQGSMKVAELIRQAEKLADLASNAPVDSSSLRQNGKSLATISYQAGSAGMSSPNAVDEAQLKNVITLVTRILASAKYAQQEQSAKMEQPFAPKNRRRDPAKVNLANPYEIGDTVAISGQDWTVGNDTSGWYLTTTGNWRGAHPTIRNIQAMTDLIREVEQAATAEPTVAEQPKTAAARPTKEETRSAMDAGLRAGTVSVEDFMKATGLTDEDVGTFQPDGLRQQAERGAQERSPYHQAVQEVRDALSKMMTFALDAASSTPQQRKSKEERIAKINRDRDTLEMIARKYEHPFDNNYVSRLSPILKSRFKKKFDEIQTGFRARDAFRENSYNAWVELLIEAANKKAGVKPATKATEDKPRLTDAGEELTRNRRNRVTGITWADVDGMNDTLKVKTVTKANVWQKPNYEKLVEDGAPRWKVAMLKAIYDKLAAKPDVSRTMSDDQMRRYVETMIKVRDAVMAELDRVESDPGVKAAFESDAVKSFASKGDDMVQAAAVMGLRSLMDGNRIMDAVFPVPNGAKMGRYDRTTEQGKDNNTNALLIGGNNALTAMQFGYKAIAKARDLLMDGFPAKQEAWQKSYDIKPRNERFFVVKKGYTFRVADGHPEAGFETEDLAQEFARELTKRTGKPLPPSRGLDLDAATRTGPDWRNGKDVTADEVKEAFGFRGVNLGEYVKANQKVAQTHLNSAYDGLMDLADLMGVPPKAISLNGTLGLAIGAQGSGRALAHFVPGVNEINITRDSGAGALAHEWGHALDHYFGVQNGDRIAKSSEPFLTEHMSGQPDGVRAEVFAAFKAMVDAMKSRTMTEDEARDWLKNERMKADYLLKSAMSDMKPTDQAAYDEASAKLKVGDVGELGADGVPVNVAKFLAAAKGGVMQQARLSMAADRVSALRDEVRFLNTHKPQTKTNYAKASSAMDAERQKAYWSTNLEMFARAFESFVMDALAERQRESLYLSGLSDGPMWKAWEKTSGQLSPFPKAEERLAINQAAQALVNAIEARETDKGVAMFSRSDRKSPGLTVAETSSIANAIAERWANAPEIVVAADMNDAAIPQAVRDYDAQQRSLGAKGDPEGFWYDGKVYLVAKSMASPSDVMRVLFHESLGHYGLRGVFGNALDPILNQIAALRRADVQAKADEYGLDLNKPDERLQAAEEVLSVMAQTKPELGYVKRAISAIRSWMRRTFPKLFGQMKLTDAEIIRDFILPARGWVEGGPGGGPNGGLPAMSRSQEQVAAEDAIRFSRTAAARAYVAPAMDKLNETFNHPGKLGWWHKTVGSMYNLAERMPAFKPVYDAAQNFINDVSFYAIEAADKAPKLLPRLEDWKDLAKSPITAQDNKAVAAPVFEGTLSWRRDESGKPVLVEDLAKRYASLTPEQKAQRLLRANAISENVLKMWQGMPKDQYASSVNTAFEGRMLKAGIVFTPDELKSIFKLNDAQVALYQEFRQSIDTSLDNMGKSDLLRVAGKDAADLKDAVMSAPDVDAAAVLLRDHLLELAQEDPDRSDALVTTANDMITRAEKVQRLKMEGYAPLSRFGQYTVDVVVDGERQYFSMFETARDANRMAAKLKTEYGAENVAQGTLSQREFEMLQGITPESLELFGNMLGLDSTGNEAQDQVFQEYLKRTKANRSAMKRLIHRKGIAGYSEDVGRVLAAFVYSNARQTSAALHMGDLGEAVMAIPKGEGELKDAAVELARYVKEPREEAAKMRGWLFAQYLGGSIASAIVNFTQPLTTSAPYLSQFGGMGKSVKVLYQAMADLKDKKFEAGLAESFRKRTEDGTLAPQGVHELMAQSRGEATLRTGDGTQVGDALAKGRNAVAKAMIGWGKLFGMAEQINRQSTYVAAYRMAVERGITDPDAFAKKAVDETQFVNNKANKMKFGRGAIGATLMTFKSYSLNWLELFHRLATQNGREGKMAAAWMLGVLLLSAGASGLPFAEDAEDLADFLAQRLGYNWSSKKARQEFLESLFGRDIAGFVENGVTGLPGAPIDVSGRLGMGNMIPGTGLFLSKKDHTSDFTEVLGPAGDLAKRTFQAGDLLLSGEVKEAAFMVAPKAIGNLQRGVDMADTGLYRDARSYTVYGATTGEAIGKAIGFQPRSITQMQEASGLHQRTKDFYRLKVERINAKWAKAIFEKDAATVDEVRAEIKEWNRQNPDQRIQANIPAILRRVKEMRKTKAERIADTAPKALRASMREEVRRMQEENR